MTRKSKNLPSNIIDIIKSGDLDRIKQSFAQCEANACECGNRGRNALFLRTPMSQDLVYWLVREHGCDPNARDQLGYTPLLEQAAFGNIAVVEALIELGSDVNAASDHKETALHRAVHFSKIAIVSTLLQHGADPCKRNWCSDTPLGHMTKLLQRNGIAHIVDGSAIATLLLAAGDNVTTEMQENIKQLGEQYERHRESITENAEGQNIIHAMQNLYHLFRVPPVPPCYHDGISRITITDGAPLAQFTALWKSLISEFGVVQTEQGEVIRIAGRICDEIYCNGGENWDDDYRKISDRWLELLTHGTPLASDDLAAARRLHNRISQSGDIDDGTDLDTIKTLAVRWVQANPAPIALTTVPYNF